MVEKLRNVDLSRLEDGDMLMPVSQIYYSIKSAVKVRTTAVSPATGTSPPTSLFVP